MYSIFPEEVENLFFLFLLRVKYPADPGTRFGHGGAAGSQGFADKERQMALGFTKNMPLATHPDHPVRSRISEILGIRKIIW